MKSVLPDRIGPTGRGSGARWWSLAPLVLLGLVILSMLAPAELFAQGYYDRRAVPGNYTIGFYADFEATTRELTLAKDEDRFEAYIGITGDSTRVFSGLVFRVELPEGVTLDGPIAWRPLAGLKQYDAVEVKGTHVNFPESCVQSTGDQPVIVGRIAFRLGPKVKRVVIEPLAHKEFGLSVELCQIERSYPKPYATGRAITVTRPLTLWDRIANWFR